MVETARFALPLVAPAQAQKHVTVNEAFSLLDVLAQLTLETVSTPLPPTTPGDGTAYFVPDGAVNDWAGQSGRIAVHLNGGWVFLGPQIGWRAYLKESGTLAAWSGAEWRMIGSGTAASGAGMSLRTVEIDHTVGTGSSSTTAAFIPDGSLVFAVSGRVVSAVTGGATSFRVGVAGAPDRYGAGIGVDAGSWLRGVTSSPQAYYADTGLLLTAEGGGFTGGLVRLAAHIAEFSLPAAS